MGQLRLGKVNGRELEEVGVEQVPPRRESARTIPAKAGVRAGQFPPSWESPQDSPRHLLELIGRVQHIVVLLCAVLVASTCVRRQNDEERRSA